MKTFIVVQMIIESEKQIGQQTDVTMSNIVRKVLAENKEQAIGKFVVATYGIKAHRKLEIECYELSDLSNID